MIGKSFMLHRRRFAEKSDANRLPIPDVKKRIQDDLFAGRLLAFDRFEKRLMIQSPGSVIVLRGIAEQNVDRNLHATSDFTKDFAFELGIGRIRLFGPDLAELPTVRQCRRHPFFQRNDIQGFQRLGFPVGR